MVNYRRHFADFSIPVCVSQQGSLVLSSVLFFRPTPSGKSIMSTSYIELFWRCPECGHDHISGLFNSTGLYCPSCSFRRDDSVELYEAPDSQVVTDPELIARIESGRVDWTCKHCGSLNEDKGIGENAMACTVCRFFQTDELQPEAVVRDKSGEIISTRHTILDRFENPVVPRSLLEFRAANDNPHQFSPKLPSFDWQSLPWRPIAWGVSIAGGIAVVVFGGWWLFAPHPLEVKVQSLPWEVTVEVQQLVPVNKSDWDETVPFGARVRSSETRQRGTQEVQRGTKTIMETEKYQSGTTIKSYTETERFQSGTTTEPYTDSERYQSGTRENCTTTSTGTGAGRRSCVSVPVYSTRYIQRSRQVPTYSTRLVPKTRTVPVYSTRQVPRTVPNMVTEPVYDTYVYFTVDEWTHEQTLTTNGVDDQPRIAPVPQLDNYPYPQRALTPQESCHVIGAYRQGDKQKVQTWRIPCNQFDRLNMGNTVKLTVNRAGQASLPQ